MTHAFKPNPRPKPHVGSDFEDFLRDEGWLEISTSLAIKRMSTRRPAVTLPTLSKDRAVLSQTAFEAFVATCEMPPKPTAALCKIMALR
jgi:hypothetical protein